MSRTLDYTIAYRVSGTATVDLCKILFGGDGSYYVTAPYHPLDRAIAARLTVNYAQEAGAFRLEDSEEVAVLDDDEKRLKVSHHPDGFLQFSGQGVRSGLTDDGRPKGMGVFSWPLQQPTLGPSFQLAFSDPLACGRPSKRKMRTIVFEAGDIEHLRKNVAGLTIVGYYQCTSGEAVACYFSVSRLGLSGTDWARGSSSRTRRSGWATKLLRHHVDGASPTGRER